MRCQQACLSAECMCQLVAMVSICLFAAAPGCRADPDVLWLHYEDLQADLPAAVALIARFLQLGQDDPGGARPGQRGAGLQAGIRVACCGPCGSLPGITHHRLAGEAAGLPIWYQSCGCGCGVVCLLGLQSCRRWRCSRQASRL